jgi:phenylalanyl-tRNA synthetase beta chain
MNLSLRWLNDYLDPGNLTKEEAEDVLTNLGSPIETWDGDKFDLEVTSNRGDLLCHLGAAREVAAKTGRKLKHNGPVPPDLRTKDAGQPASNFLKLTNSVPDSCPLFTARVIKGVKVGPSPAWLKERLESIGQRSINNVVDVTNFITFELGNPCHAFDLAKLEGSTLEIRWARPKEELTTLDGKKRILSADELVVADAKRATSLAGVIGGAGSEVSDSTTDVVFEVATWDPGTIRRAARRHGIRTDASFRFERIVDPRTLQYASDRGAALIVHLAGGKLLEGTLTAGKPLPPFTTIQLRPQRCRELLGIDVSIEEMERYLLGQCLIEFKPMSSKGKDAVDEIWCTVEPGRPDLTREVDLIEEVARLKGLAAIPIHERVEVAVKPPQATETARRELAEILAGLGFFEAVTFSFTTPKEAALFLPKGLKESTLAEQRSAAEPALRPSVLTGLLACRRQNQHAQNHVEGGLRLFEAASVYAQTEGNKSIENLNLGLLLDLQTKGKSAANAELQHAIRLLRGSIESAVASVAGPGAALTFTPAQPHAAAFDQAAFAQVSLNNKPLGYLGLLTKEIQALYDLAAPVVGAELNLPALLATYPPKTKVHELPAFPGIERDISIVIPESIPWSQVESLARKAQRPPLERVVFVGTFRNEKLGKGKKSLTLRLSFRDDSRTLRHEEVDAPTADVISTLKSQLGAELRA